MPEKAAPESLSFPNDLALDKKLLQEHRRLGAEMRLEEERNLEALGKPKPEELDHSRRSIEKDHADFTRGCELLAGVVERVARGLAGQVRKFGSLGMGLPIHAHIPDRISIHGD